MLKKTRLVRKSNTLQKEEQKAKYNQFIDFAFQKVQQEDYADEATHLLELTKNHYLSLVDEDVEVDGLLIAQLREYRAEGSRSLKKIFVINFQRMLSLFQKAKIIPDFAYKDLVDFGDDPQILTNELSKTIEDPRILLTNLHKDQQTSNFLAHVIELHTENDQIMQTKLEVIESVHRMFGKVNFTKFDPKLQVKLEMYGSFTNKLSLKDSDIDMTILTNNENINKFKLLKFFYREILPELKQYRTTYEELPQANLPFIDVTFKDLDVKVSFIVNNFLAVRNSKLIKLYTEVEPRCRLLALLVKIWATKNGIISARKFYLSSYAYSLMVINFLQTINPQVLPSLHMLKKYSKDSQDSKVNKYGHETVCDEVIDFEDDLDRIKQVMNTSYSDNKLTVMELFIEFMKFYGDSTRFEKLTLSIREGGLIPQDKTANIKYLFSIQDPFDLDQNAGRHVRIGTSQSDHILRVMKETTRLLEENKLKKIFYKKPMVHHTYI